MMDSLQPTSFGRDVLCLFSYVAARRDLDRHQGQDPLPGLRELLATAQQTGVAGINLQLLAWNVAVLTLDPRERVALGSQLLEDLLALKTHIGRRQLLELEVAEAHVQAGSSGGRALALQAAREFRRGRTTPAMSVPEGLLRCARLLEPTDPKEAAALIHVARRWVRQALPHVPDVARESFINDVPVNRLLLSGQM